MPFRLDKLGVVIALLTAWGLLAPFVTFRANRIVAGDPVGGWAALPTEGVLVLFTVVMSLRALRSCARTPLSVWLQASRRCSH